MDVVAAPKRTPFFSAAFAGEACILLFARLPIMLKRPAGFHMGDSGLDYAVPRKWMFASMKANICSRSI